MKAYHTFRDRGLRAKKSLGQHFLVDPHAVLKIVDAAELSKSDTVLEVGPGPGTLTVHLAQRAGQVIAVEVDEQMLVPLREQLAGHENVRIVCGDILEQDIPALVGRGPYKVVANLPYYITSAVLRHLFESAVRPTIVVVTVQREVAERIVAHPGQRGNASRMSLLAVSVQFYGVPRIVARIPAGAFRPVPAVDSAVVRIEAYDPLPWDVRDRACFFETVRAGFAQSRKQLHNALAHSLASSRMDVWAALERAGIDGRRRAETLSIEEWAALSNALVQQMGDSGPCDREAKEEPSRA
jgi:16S rRNA (adenine1518-N6/adenine1519-N6)-dimethyltransferase